MITIQLDNISLTPDLGANCSVGWRGLPVSGPFTITNSSVDVPIGGVLAVPESITFNETLHTVGIQIMAVPNCGGLPFLQNILVSSLTTTTTLAPTTSTSTTHTSTSTTTSSSSSTTTTTTVAATTTSTSTTVAPTTTSTTTTVAPTTTTTTTSTSTSTSTTTTTTAASTTTTTTAGSSEFTHKGTTALEACGRTIPVDVKWTEPFTTGTALFTDVGMTVPYSPGIYGYISYLDVVYTVDSGGVITEVGPC